jgi:hypothetical protein
MSVYPFQRKTKSDYEVESIRSLTPDVSLVRIGGHMEFSNHFNPILL